MNVFLKKSPNRNLLIDHIYSLIYTKLILIIGFTIFMHMLYTHIKKYAYTHIYMFMQKYTYICWIHTDAINKDARIMIKKEAVINDAGRKTQEDFFNNILPLPLLQGFERVVQGLHVRGSWRPNINCNILTPLLWPSRCVLLVQPEA